MHWSAYEVFSVISGVILIVAGFLPRLSGRDRFWALVGGVLILGYGIYVANQTSGTYYFPAIIFIVPVIAIVYLIATAAGVTKGGRNRQ